MKNKINLLLVLLVLTSMALKADSGPKPTKVFTLYFNTSKPFEIKNQWLLECSDAKCTSFDTMKSQGPQLINCTNEQCKALSYGFKPFNKLVLEFADRTLESNVIEGHAFNSTYDVKITENEIKIVETTSFWSRYSDRKSVV